MSDVDPERYIDKETTPGGIIIPEKKKNKEAVKYYFNYVKGIPNNDLLDQKNLISDLRIELKKMMVKASALEEALDAGKQFVKENAPENFLFDYLAETTIPDEELLMKGWVQRAKDTLIHVINDPERTLEEEDRELQRMKMAMTPEELAKFEEETREIMEANRRKAEAARAKSKGKIIIATE